jgi:hypothetical protein
MTDPLEFLKFIGPRGQKIMRSANNVGNAGPHVRQTFLNDVVFWIYNYLYNECPSPLTFQFCSLKGVLDPTLYDKVLSDLRQVNGFSPGTPVSSFITTDCLAGWLIVFNATFNNISAIS